MTTHARAGKATIAERRARVAELILQKRNTVDISRCLKIPEHTVNDDVDAIRSAWRDDAVGDIGKVIAQDLAALCSDEAKLRERWKLEVSTVRWLQIHDRIMRVLERRAKMMGLDAPEELRLDASTLNEVVTLMLKAVIPHVVDPAARVALADEVAAIRERFTAGKWSQAPASIRSAG